jgi:hypothetical protein
MRSPLIAVMGFIQIIRRRRQERQRRQALALLASCPDGCTEGLLRAYGFTSDLPASLIHEGLATAGTQRLGHAANSIEIRRVKITRAGKRELIQASPLGALLPDAGGPLVTCGSAD